MDKDLAKWFTFDVSSGIQRLLFNTLATTRRAHVLFIQVGAILAQSDHAGAILSHANRSRCVAAIDNTPLLARFHIMKLSWTLSTGLAPRPTRLWI
jgi:hypothetical protein